MTTRTNDPAMTVIRLADVSNKHEDTAAASVANVAWSIKHLLGDAERLGASVVPMLTWAKSPQAKEAVLARILLVCECDRDAIKAAVKAAPSNAKGVELDAKLRGRAYKIAKALDLLGAISILEDRTSNHAQWDDKGNLKFPCTWFLPEGYTIVNGKNGPRMHEIERTASKAVLRATRDEEDGTDREGEIHDLKFSPTVQGIVDAANGGKKEKRNARPGGNEKSNDGESSDGSADEQPQERKRATPSEARDICALEAGRDDYKHRPTGDVAVEWQSMFDHMAINPYYRAMMIKAIAKANKAEGDAAASQAAA